MKRFIAMTIAGAAIAAIIGPRGPLGGFWAPMPMLQPPQGAILAGLVGESIVEMLAFGAGGAVLLLGRRWFVARTTTATRATTTWLAAVWLLASWMPHSALHLHVGMQPRQLLPVEWIFHGGAIAATAAMLWAILSGATASRQASASILPGRSNRNETDAGLPHSQARSGLELNTRGY